MSRSGRILAGVAGRRHDCAIVRRPDILYQYTGWGWAVWPGIAGCLAIMLAAGLVVPVFIGQCVRHRIRLQRLGKHFYRQSVKPAVRRYGLKTSLLLAGLLLLAPLVPYVLELVKIIAYVAGLVIAGRLGLLGRNHQYDYISGAPTGGIYNYATGEVDDGLDIGGLYDE